MLFDTTILVDYLRGRAEARDLLEAIDNKPNISVASTLELYAGVRSRRDEQLTEQLLSQVALLPVTHDIAKRASVFVRLYHASHGVAAMDAIGEMSRLGKITVADAEKSLALVNALAHARVSLLARAAEKLDAELRAAIEQERKLQDAVPAWLPVDKDSTH